MPTQPGKAALDDPIEPGDLERLLRSPDDLELPAVLILQVSGQAFDFVTSIRDHGIDCRPQRGLPASQETSCSSIRHCRKYDQTVPQGGRRGSDAIGAGVSPGRWAVAGARTLCRPGDRGAGEVSGQRSRITYCGAERVSAEMRETGFQRIEKEPHLRQGPARGRAEGVDFVGAHRPLRQHARPAFGDAEGRQGREAA